MSENVNILELSGISKTFSDNYGTRKNVIDNISLKIGTNAPKISSILASFGGGKSTLFKIIAGAEKPDSGVVFLKGEKYLRANGKIVLIPENPASLPWLNVRKNIELVYRLDTCRKKGGNPEIDDLINLVGLSGYENHFPHNNSAGFRFRICIARALLFDPVVLLLDDCFKKMDAATREEMYVLVHEISKKLDSYFLLATTNVSEALRLSGRVFLMSKSPARIYNEFEISGDFFQDYKNERFIEYRRKIEEAYMIENKQETMNFSI